MGKKRENDDFLSHLHAFILLRKLIHLYTISVLSEAKCKKTQEKESYLDMMVLHFIFYLAKTVKCIKEKLQRDPGEFTFELYHNTGRQDQNLIRYYISVSPQCAGQNQHFHLSER